MIDKNKYLKQICVVCSCLLLTSCFDLEYESFNRIPSDGYPQSEADLEAATIGVYSTLGKSYIMVWLNNAGWTLNELPTDELNTGWGNPWILRDRFQWTANNEGGVINCYNEYQKGITKATRIIEAFEHSLVNKEKKDRYIAELRAMRALYAQLLYSLVGPVPIVIDPAIANDVYTEWKPERPSQEQYVNFLVSELEEVYPSLCKTVTEKDWGRMTQGSALTLLMKIYLNNKDWVKAAETAKRVMDLEIYDLLPVYKDVFAIENEGPINKEVIFSIQRITSNTSYAWSYFSSVYPSTPVYKSPTGIIVNVSGGLKMPWNFYDKYEATDSRLETIIRYYTDVDGNEVDFRQVQHSKATGAIPMKYSEDPNQQGAMQGNDFVMFRYADVLLSRAEALNELNGPTAEAVELINRIRRRAHVKEIKASDYTKETLRDFILDERGRELYCEGHRRDDLIRHGKFIQKAREEGIDAQDYHVLYPIPQGIMNENPNLRQNPGYEN